jgi:putative tricarboxylic transport membrane protein
MKWLQISLIPLVLAVVLGDMLETNLRLALNASKGDISIFFSSAVSVSFLALAAFTIMWPFIMQWKKKRAPVNVDAKTQGS